MAAADVRLGSVVLASRDPSTLAAFYEGLLGWTRLSDEPGWVRIGPVADVRPSLSFQLERSYVAPVWPAVEGQPQMEMHLDLAVDDLEGAAARAVALGAVAEARQPQRDVRVMRDPHGHVFCLFELE